MDGAVLGLPGQHRTRASSVTLSMRRVIGVLAGGNIRGSWQILSFMARLKWLYALVKGL